jgi:hypothetical protein
LERGKALTTAGHDAGAQGQQHKYRLRPGMRAIGWREWLAIPEWEVARIKAKIDTGARTSALHADNLRYFTRDGVSMVRFKLHPHQRSQKHTVVIEAPIIDQRVVRSSSGEEDLRPVVRTHVELHGVCWPIEVTLARRKLMGFRMLLGREAMWDRFIVDPSRSFLGGEPCMPLEDSEVLIGGRTAKPGEAPRRELKLAQNLRDEPDQGRARSK